MNSPLEIDVTYNGKSTPCLIFPTYKKDGFENTIELPKTLQRYLFCVASLYSNRNLTEEFFYEFAYRYKISYRSIVHLLESYDSLFKYECYHRKNVPGLVIERSVESPFVNWSITNLRFDVSRCPTLTTKGFLAFIGKMTKLPSVAEQAFDENEYIKGSIKDVALLSLQAYGDIVAIPISVNGTQLLLGCTLHDLVYTISRDVSCIYTKQYLRRANSILSVRLGSIMKLNPDYSTLGDRLSNSLRIGSDKWASILRDIHPLFSEAFRPEHSLERTCSITRLNTTRIQRIATNHNRFEVNPNYRHTINFVSSLSDVGRFFAERENAFLEFFDNLFENDELFLLALVNYGTTKHKYIEESYKNFSTINKTEDWFWSRLVRYRDPRIQNDWRQSLLFCTIPDSPLDVYFNYTKYADVADVSGFNDDIVGSQILIGNVFVNTGAHDGSAPVPKDGKIIISEKSLYRSIYAQYED